MKNILNKNDFVSLRNRIEAIDGNENAQWGKMDINGMLCHIADQIRIVTGEKKCNNNSTGIKSTILKKMVLFGVPTPKGKIDTASVLDQQFGGTKPTNINDDKSILYKLMNDVEKSFEDKKFIEHPEFGKMSLDEWGRLIHVHMDHHLKQFGK